MYTPELVITIFIFTISSFLLVTNLVRGDHVAILIVVSLMASGVLTVQEALSGFSSPVVVIITSMFIISEAIVYTGIAQRLGEAVIEKGGSNETRLMVLLMATACLVGAFMSSTATVAIFAPVAMTVAQKANLNHRRLLMPLAIGALISGMMTLVATSPNIVVNNALSSLGQDKLSFFSFTPFGIVVLIACVAFIVLYGRNLLDKRKSVSRANQGRSIHDLMQYYRIEQDMFVFAVPPRSEMVDKEIARLQLGNQYHVKLIGLLSHDNGTLVVKPVRPETVIREGDMLAVIARRDKAEVFAAKFRLSDRTKTFEPSAKKSFYQVIGAAEVMLTPDSPLIGKSIKETAFQTLFHCMVVGVRRKGETITDKITDLPLLFGDVLLVSGAWDDILKLQDQRDQYLLLTLPLDHHEVIKASRKASITLAVLGIMVALMVCNVTQNVIAILGAAAALLMFRCVNVETYYKIIEWKTVFLIAGILPLALAVQKTGASGFLTDFMMRSLGDVSPVAVLSVIFLITVVMGLFISNTPAAIIIAPVAIDIGMKLGISPQACAMTVAIASSAAFLSPMGSPVNMVVREPGGYSGMDFMRIGAPLLAITMLLTVFMAWLIYL